MLKAYSGSIILINDTDLIAIAKHENYEESDIVSYHYNVIIIITIFFDPRGGIINNFSKEVMKNKPYGDLPIPVKENYEFDGWFSDLSWNNKITSETIVNFSENMTLYAKWINNDEIVEVVATDSVSSIQTNKINEITIKASESNNKIMIIGISIGCAIVVVIVIVISILIVAFKRKRKRVQNLESENEDMQSNP